MGLIEKNFSRKNIKETEIKGFNNNLTKKISLFYL